MVEILIILKSYKLAYSLRIIALLLETSFILLLDLKILLVLVQLKL
jgi:hypothetical protein